MARVSFEDVKRVAIALGWVFCFGCRSGDVRSRRFVPGWGGRESGVATAPTRSSRSRPRFGRLLKTLLVVTWMASQWSLVPWLQAALVASASRGRYGVVFGARRLTGDWNVWAAWRCAHVGLVPRRWPEELGFAGIRCSASPTGLAFSRMCGRRSVPLLISESQRSRLPRNIFLPRCGCDRAAAAGVPPLSACPAGNRAALLFVRRFGYLLPRPRQIHPGLHAGRRGAFGPEGGIVATIAPCRGLVLLTRRARSPRSGRGRTAPRERSRSWAPARWGNGIAHVFAQHGGRPSSSVPKMRRGWASASRRTPRNRRRKAIRRRTGGPLLARLGRDIARRPRVTPRSSWRPRRELKTKFEIFIALDRLYRPHHSCEQHIIDFYHGDRSAPSGLKDVGMHFGTVPLMPLSKS